MNILEKIDKYLFEDYANIIRAKINHYREKSGAAKDPEQRARYQKKISGLSQQLSRLGGKKFNL